MKKIFYLIGTAFLLGITSCSDDACDHPTDGGGGTTPDVMGIWYEEAENEEMRFNQNGTFYDKYCNKNRSAETEGRWEYDKANKKLTYTYSYLGQMQYADWTVKNLTEFGFTISSTMVADHPLEKVVETYNMKVGETATIQFQNDHQNYTVKSFQSKNPRLASVSENGTITAEGEKGTTYIKIETAYFNVWAKVVVGDDCLDLWYDYPSLMGTDFNNVKKTLGIPSITGDDGYSYGYSLSQLNDYSKEIDIFLNTSTGAVKEMALALKASTPESLVQTYVNSHYYPYELIGDNYYSTSSEIDKSIAVVEYDKKNKCIRFLETSSYSWPDYTSDFGLTTSQIVSKYGPLYYDILPYYGVANILVGSIYFSIDDTTDKVTAFQLTINSDIDGDKLHKFLSKKYNFYKSDDTNTQFAYRDDDSQETSKIMLVYNKTKGTVTYYDLLNYGKSSSARTRAANLDQDFFDIDITEGVEINK